MGLDQVRGLVQDAIFSRRPQDGARTAVLIGGRDPILALDMFEAAKQAMVPPHFQISVMVDPSGAFTTAAAMVAVAERCLAARGDGLAGMKVVVFGATGPVGGMAGLMAARAGAKVVLAGHDGVHRVAMRAEQFGERTSVALMAADASIDERKVDVLQDADIAFAAGRAGVRILTLEHLRRAPKLKLVVDVNAVPPSGVEGVDPFADCKPIEGTQILAIGALAVGDVKFRTERELLESMRDADPRRFIGIDETLEAARRHAARR
ncbi:NAD(P)-dependent methylenetetrahydromethanopterin dehydrogenase [bacterium HR39]|nr:NAD(P)-dependent methylenetetrahydromethanopterin dehydrogenase [bacterium HR39]